MKKSILYILLATTALSGCCHKKQLAKQTSTGANILNSYSAYYYHTTEASYEEVTIKNGILTSSFFKDAKGDCGKAKDQKPCWTMETLTKKEATITQSQLDSLFKTIDNTGFWKLDSVIGNPGENERYYSFSLSFASPTNKNEVLFNSVPGGTPMPDAFRKSRDVLMMFARGITK